MGLVEELAPGKATAPDLIEAERARAENHFDAALEAYQSVLSIYPRRADALAGRGAVLRAMGRPHEALIDLLEALNYAPHYTEAQLELALALRESGRGDEARTLYGLLLRAPDAPAAAWHGLALLLLSEGHDLAAEACLRRTIAMAPDNIDARLNLADLLVRRDDLAGAVDFYQDILAISQSCAAAHSGLGQALIGLGRLGEAEDQLERALVMDSENPLAHMGRARLNLLDGNLPAAWEDMEWRWPLAGRARPSPPGQLWDGSTDLTGQTILLWAEQGVGEIIHLLRHVARVAHTGAQVVLGVPATLAPLAAAMDGVARVLVSGQPVPSDVTIHYNASLADLPRLFGTDLASVQSAPYLTVPQGRQRPISAPATAMVKVGLVWSGGRHTIPMGQLAPLLSMPGIALFGLQTGPHARDIAELAHPSLIADLSATIFNTADLAGRLAEMDVVITVDGPAAHLAGALGVPVWVLLPTAPDWRWMLERDDSPYYTSARLFRQNRPDNWNGPIQRVCAALREKIAEAKAQRAQAARALSGGMASARAFLAAHLMAGDVLVDVGSGDGTHALDAAAHPSGDITVLLVEARTSEAGILADTMAIAGAEDTVEVIHAALSATAGPAVVAQTPRPGRTVFPLPHWVRAAFATTTLDSLLEARPELAERRLVLCVGAKGAEADVLAGLSAEPAILVFKHRAGSPVADHLREAGYAQYRFPGDLAAGPVVPFTDQECTVLALAPGLAPAAIYGDTTDATSPAAMAHARALGARLAHEGSVALTAGKLNDAGALFARALAADPGNVEANANLGTLLRRIGRGDAACACWGRALAGGAGAGVRANAANVLRELGYLLASESYFLEALAAEPDNAKFLYGFGLLENERGRAKEALALFERAEHLAPGTVPRRDYAGALLKSGNLARGMAEMAHRPAPALAPVDAPVWDGTRLDARTILVRDENDAIDTVMLSRFIPQVARQGGLVIVECVPEAVRLMGNLPGVEQAVARGEPLPQADFTINLLDVPRLIGTTSRTTPPRDVPYLHLPDEVVPHVFTDDHRLRVGIAWAGRPTDGSVPLSALLRLAATPGITLISLQRGPRATDLIKTGAHAFVEDLGTACTDLADTAALIAGLDLVITTDTTEAHLAGAMGKPVWVLLPQTCDWRWVDGREDSVWYPTMRVFRQATDGTWTRAIARMAEAAAAMAAGKRGRG
ncbi:MAG: tetratricopeptide repeat protein [Rhodospirillaceae bacterium]|nr:tetratricopeptide repeat protein [Rhodospirillales bacterium]